MTLAHLLERAGIESVILESQSREYVEKRIRAGVLEQGTVDLFRELGLADRLELEGIEHRGIIMRFDGEDHRIAFDQYGDKSIWIYGQQEVVRDLISARVRLDSPLVFDAQVMDIEGLDTDPVVINYVDREGSQQLTCDIVAGCDGFHGVSRQSIPAGSIREYVHDYPFGWLGILAAVEPSTDELIYASHSRGFALHSLRSPELSRLYVQCSPGDQIEEWSDRRIWDEMHHRFERDGWSLKEGPIIEKSITGMRSYVAEPMQYGNLYLAGDAAHIVPPTGAKGLNLAIADVRVLASGIVEQLQNRNPDILDQYSALCLKRVWKVMHFSWWMTSLLHKFDDDTNGTIRKLQLAQLEYVTSSAAASASLAEQYTGLP